MTDSNDPARAAAGPDDDDGPEVVPPIEWTSRRRFLNRFCLGVASALGAVVAVPMAIFLGAPVVKKKEYEWFDVGAAEEFHPGTTKLISYNDVTSLPWSGVTSNAPGYVRRELDGSLKGFSAVCRHLGCPVRWEAGAELFMCPCHGGVYNDDGSVAAGPPPEGLAKLDVREVDGRVQVMPIATPLTLTTESQV